MVSTLFTLSTAKEKVSLRLNNQPVPQVETPKFLGVTLDTRLTWKPHLEPVEAKATRKLAIMKKLAGTTWGANSDILKQVYTGAVRPVVEYASTIWDTASKTNKSKLDRVQNMGLRIILGAMRSTPIQQMEKTTDLQPLECRREYKAAIQGEKLKRLTSHPFHQKLQHGTKNCLKRKSFKHKLKDLQKENADLLEADPGKCEELTMSVWASRKSLPEVRIEIPGLAAKGTQAPELQKALTLQMIQSRYPKSTWTHVFTDGSAENAVRNGGSGAYIRRPDGTTPSLSIPAGDLSSNYRAEVHALKAATELLIEEDCNQQNIILLSDSLSALQSLTNGPTDFRTQQLHNSLRTLSDNNRVVLQWVPAQVGIAGNETADRLAKAAAKLPQPHFSSTYKEVKTLLKQKQKSAWRLRNHGYDPQKDQINTLDRRTQTTIFRLRTGHCGLRKHLKRLDLADSAHCDLWLWRANPWAHSSDLPTPGDSTPTVLARRHWSGHQALGASSRTTADGGLPSSHQPEDLARSSHQTQKKNHTSFEKIDSWTLHLYKTLWLLLLRRSICFISKTVYSQLYIYMKVSRNLCRLMSPFWPVNLDDTRHGGKRDKKAKVMPVQHLFAV